MRSLPLHERGWVGACPHWYLTGFHDSGLWSTSCKFNQQRPRRCWWVRVIRWLVGLAHAMRHWDFFMREWQNKLHPGVAEAQYLVICRATDFLRHAKDAYRTTAPMSLMIISGSLKMADFSLQNLYECSFLCNFCFKGRNSVRKGFYGIIHLRSDWFQERFEHQLKYKFESFNYSSWYSRTDKYSSIALFWSDLLALVSIGLTRLDGQFLVGSIPLLQCYSVIQWALTISSIANPHKSSFLRSILITSSEVPIPHCSIIHLGCGVYSYVLFPQEMVLFHI